MPTQLASQGRRVGENNRGFAAEDECCALNNPKGLTRVPFSDCFGWGIRKLGSRSKIHRIRIPLLSFDPSNQRDNYTTDTANTRVTKVANRSTRGYTGPQLVGPAGCPAP